ncbi:hypothetical protein X975_18606, partial [Stegodyphus mimosarum]
MALDLVLAMVLARAMVVLDMVSVSTTVSVVLDMVSVVMDMVSVVLDMVSATVSDMVVWDTHFNITDTNMTRKVYRRKKYARFSKDISQNITKGQNE